MEVTGIYTSFSMEGSLDPFEQLLTIIEMNDENTQFGRKLSTGFLAQR